MVVAAIRASVSSNTWQSQTENVFPCFTVLATAVIVPSGFPGLKNWMLPFTVVTRQPYPIMAVPDTVSASEKRQPPWMIPRGFK